MAQGKNGGIGIYDRLLMEARMKGEVGVNLHMKRPTEIESRLGYRGKPLSKKAKVELAEKMKEAAQRNPALRAAADNCARIAENLKAEGKKAAKKEAKPERTMSVEEVRALLKQLEAQEKPTPVQVKAPVQAQPKPAPKKDEGPTVYLSKEPKPETKFDEHYLRQKLLAEAKAKLARNMEVVQYSDNIIIKTRNNPG
jgi:hypothetical protein